MKKNRSTEVDPFWNVSDIKNMIDIFEKKQMHHWHLAFMLGLLLGRRVGDILSFKWRDFYFKDGKIRRNLVLTEQKTWKTSDIVISQELFSELEWYKKIMNIDMQKSFNDYLIPSESKTAYDLHVKNFPLYKEDYTEKSDEELKEIIEKWCDEIGREYNAEEILTEYKNICNARKKNKSEMNFAEFLMDKEWTLAIKSQGAAYRKQFKMAADICHIDYPVSCHTPRKTFAYWSVKLHPYDGTVIDTLQSMLKHSDRNETIHYAGLDKENATRLYEDISTFVSDVKEGKENVRNNSPIISLKTEDFRNIILKAAKDCANGKNIEDILSECIKVSDDLRIK